MENQCKGCLFEDDIHENDFISLSRRDEKLYCPMFKEGIPKNILEDKDKCIAKIDKNEK